MSIHAATLSLGLTLALPVPEGPQPAAALPVASPATQPPPSGRAMLAAGIILTTIGLPAMIFGGLYAESGFCPGGCQWPQSPGRQALYVLPGVLLLASGATLTAVGGVRFARWQRRLERRTVHIRASAWRAPSDAWTLGVRMQF